MEIELSLVLVFFLDSRSFVILLIVVAIWVVLPHRTIWHEACKLLLPFVLSRADTLSSGVCQALVDVSRCFLGLSSTSQR